MIFLPLFAATKTHSANTLHFALVFCLQKYPFNLWSVSNAYFKIPPQSTNRAECTWLEHPFFDEGAFDSFEIATWCALYLRTFAAVYTHYLRNPLFLLVFPPNLNSNSNPVHVVPNWTQYLPIMTEASRTKELSNRRTQCNGPDWWGGAAVALGSPRPEPNAVKSHLPFGCVLIVGTWKMIDFCRWWNQSGLKLDHVLHLFNHIITGRLYLFKSCVVSWTVNFSSIQWVGM